MVFSFYVRFLVASSCFVVCAFAQSETFKKSSTEAATTPLPPSTPLPENSLTSAVHSKRVVLSGGLTNLNFGVTKPGTSISVTLDLVNERSRDLEVLEATLSCGCIKVSPGNKTIAAGSSTNMQLSISVPPTPGSFHQQILLKLQEPSNRSTQFTHNIMLHYKASPDIDLVPQAKKWILDEGNEHGGEPFVFEMFGYRGTSLDGVELFCDCDNIQFTKSAILTPLSDETSRFVTFAELIDKNNQKFPEIVSFVARNSNSESVVAHVRIVIDRRHFVELMPNSIKVNSEGVATFYAKFGNLNLRDPSFSARTAASVSLPLSSRMINANLFEVVVSDVPVGESQQFPADEKMP